MQHSKIWRVLLAGVSGLIITISSLGTLGLGQAQAQPLHETLVSVDQGARLSGPAEGDFPTVSNGSTLIQGPDLLTVTIGSPSPGAGVGRRRP